jgi:hypothetical protein
LPIPCRADHENPHEATRRTGYCELHHAEYECARKRLKSARNNFRCGATTRPPGSLEDYLEQVGFTRLTRSTSTSAPAQALAASPALVDSLEVITGVLGNPANLYTAQSWAQAGHAHIEAVRLALDVLLNLTEDSE